MRASAVFPIVLLFFCCISVTGQEFGGYPVTSRWRHRFNDSLDIIFPATLEQKASAIAHIISRIPTDLPSPHGVRQLPLVLQQRTTLSNGYVGMGPYRSEFQLTPLQNSFRLGSLPWYALLSLHEYRHVQQFDYFNRGISRTVYKVLGQEAGALLNSLAIPNWFWEGDAVWQETNLSSQGRGRIPYFLNDVRALVRSDRRYCYMKWRNGSYRDLLPDHYPLGYLLIGYGREQYGDDVWKKTITDAVRFKPIIYPFQGGFKRATGISFRHFTENALAHFRSVETNTTDSLSAWASRQRHFISNNEFPSWLDDHSVLYVKSSYKEIPSFYIYNTQTKIDHKITTRRISIDNQFSLKNGRFVYAAYQADRRWSWSDYSVLVIHELATNTERQVTTKTRYFSPDIDSAGTQIVAVHIDSESNSQLHLLNASNGALVAELGNAPNYFITYPKYVDADHVIAALRDESGKMGIGQWTISTGDFRLVLPFSSRIIGFLQVYKNRILFTATNRDRESAFMLDGDALFQVQPDSVTHASVYQPSFNGGTLVLSGMSIAGTQLITVSGGKCKEQNLATWLDQPLTGGYPLKIAFSGQIVPEPVDTSIARPSTPYNKASHLLNFHSLRPYVSDPDYSLTLVSENVLNDLRTELSFLYNRNEGYRQIGLFATYAGLFPWIRAGVDFTFDRIRYLNNKKLTWNEWQPRIGISIPLDYTQGYHYRNLQASLDYVYTKQIISGYYKDSLQGINFGYLNPSLSWTSRTQQAKQNIYPKFAQSILLDYRQAIHGATIRQFLASLAFYFPGFSVNHSFVMQLAAQYRNDGNYQFANNFPFSRGYSVINFKGMERAGLNYHFPVAYPDAGIGQVVYVLRVRANPYFDITRATRDTKQRTWYRTLGAEIFFDTRWWNQQAVSFGIRYSRLLDDDIFGRTPNQWEFILPINLIRR